MRITKWEIANFGMFQGTEIMNLPKSGVCVLLGPNESGKSTIVAFIKGVLFGFHTQPELASFCSNSDNTPLKGKVFFEMSDGNYVVQREGMRGAVVTLPDGQTGNEIDLQRLMGGADHVVFQSVFAFSAQELHSLGALGADGVRERIFSASVVGAGRSAIDIAKQLDERMKSLVATSNDDARGNRLALELKNAAARLDDARADQAGYALRLSERDAMKKTILDLSDQRSALRKNLVACEKLIEVWPIWCERKNIQTALSECPATPDFSEGADVQLNSMVSQLQSARTDLMQAILDQRLALRRRRNMRSPGSYVGANSLEAEDLAAGVTLHRERLEKRRQLRLDAERHAQSVTAKLAALNVELDDKQILELMASFPGRHEIRAWEEKIEVATEAVARAALEKKSADVRHADLERSLDLIKNRMMSEPVSKNVIRDQEQAVIRMRTNLSSLTAMDMELAQLTKAIDEADIEIRKMENLGHHSVSKGLTWLSWSAAAVTLGGAAYELWLGHTVLGVNVGCTALLIAGLAWNLGKLQRQLMFDQDTRPVRIEDQIQKLSQMRAALSAKTTEKKKLAAQLAQDGASVGLHTTPVFHLIEEVQSALVNKKLKRTTYDADKLEADSLQVRLDEAAQQQKEKAAEHERAEAALAGLQQEWNEARVAWKPFDILHPKDAAYVLEQLRNLSEEVQSRDDVHKQLGAIDKIIDAYEDRMHRVLGLVRFGDVDSDGLIEKLLEFRERCASDKELHSQYLALESEVLTRGLHIKKAKHEHSEGKKRLERKLRAVSAADAAEFQTLYDRFQLRRSLQKQLSDIENEFTKRLGAGPDSERLTAELEKGAVAEWNVELASLKDREDVLEKKREETFQRMGALDAEITRLEESSALVQAETEQNGLRDDLEGVVRSYRVLGLAKALLAQGLREFEQSRQSELLTQATNMFSEATQGRYNRISYTESECALTVSATDGKVVKSEELSRSTQEMLYLSLRLGLVIELSRRLGQNFPLLMDDILNNCDPTRAQATAQMLTTFAKNHQLLFFTCHPHVRDMFRSLSEHSVVDPTIAVSFKAA
jgi:uncharacterized protein YhaN